MTLEQRIIAALAAGDHNVLAAIAYGVFGQQAQSWLAKELARKQQPARADCLDEDPPASFRKKMAENNR